MRRIEDPSSPFPDIDDRDVDTLIDHGENANQFFNAESLEAATLEIRHPCLIDMENCGGRDLRPFADFSKNCLPQSLFQFRDWIVDRHMRTVTECIKSNDTVRAHGESY